MNSVYMLVVNDGHLAAHEMQRLHALTRRVPLHVLESYALPHHLLGSSGPVTRGGILVPDAVPEAIQQVQALFQALTEPPVLDISLTTQLMRCFQHPERNLTTAASLNAFLHLYQGQTLTCVPV